MITQIIAWALLAVVGCAAFAALGMWAALTDEGYRRQRLANAMRPISVRPRPTAERDVTGQVPVLAGSREKVSSPSG